MPATSYLVAATPSSPNPKIILNLKSAKREADARAKLDRVDVEVRTLATNRLSYTAQGAPAVEAPAAPAAPQEDTLDTAAVAEQDEPTAAPADDTQEQDGEAIDMSGFEAALAEVVGDAQSDDAPADDDTDSEPQDGQGDADTDEEPAAPAADDNGGHRGQADCGCSVEEIIRTGEHQKGCADAPKAQAEAKAVERDRPARPATTRKGGGGRRESQGPSVVDGWDLLYDKPKQKAQVGRNAAGQYALICTTHQHAHPLKRLVQERGLRGGQRSVWCPECTGK